LDRRQIGVVRNLRCSVTVSLVVTSRFLATASLAAAVVGAQACVVSVDHEGTIERLDKRFTVDKAANLTLYTFDGAIEVRSWDKSEVLVQIEKRGQDKEAVSKIDILSDQKDDKIQVEARYTGRTGFVGFGIYHSPSAKLIASVPRNINLSIRTGDGSVIVERVNGKTEIHTGDGTIRTSETLGELLAETGDGSIHIEDVSGRVEARTGDGSIRLTGTPSALRARSGDGSIVLRIRNGASMAEDWMVATNDGTISVELPDGFNAEIEADPSSDGRVRNDLTLTGMSGGTRESRTLKGKLGDGGKRLTLRTGDGTIRLTNY
jgi:hypothetical protein